MMPSPTLRTCTDFLRTRTFELPQGTLAAAYASFLVTLLLWAAYPAHAQTQAFSASLGGYVRDISGAAVPQAKVTLISPQKGITRTSRTESDGQFSFTLLPPATYTLSVEATGLNTYRQEGIVLSVGQVATQNVALSVGAVQEQITVTGEGPILSTDNANVAADITEQQVTQLPVNLRNVYGLVALNSSVNNSSQNQVVNAPGTQGTADQDISFFNFGGGYFGTSAFLLDGSWDTAGDWGGVIFVPSMENTQEFKIQTNGFTAQYGWSTGNVVNVVTKSGTNSFHGDAFEFLRNSVLDANNYFNNLAGIPKSPFRRNQFGFTAGGPLYLPGLYPQRNKTFIFGVYEGLRQGSPLTYVNTVPTSAMKSGDFSALLGGQAGTDALGRPILSGQIYNPFTTRQLTTGQVDPVTGLMASRTGYIRDPIPGNRIPSSMMSSVAKNLLQYWPNPTSTALVNNFTAAASAPVGSDEYSIRVDHNVTDNSRLFGRWSQKRQYKVVMAPFYGTDNIAGPGVRNPNNRLNGGLGFTHVFNPSTVMSLNSGYSRWVEGNEVQGYPFNSSSLGLPAFIDGATKQFPIINISGMAPLGPQSGFGQGAFPRAAISYSVDLNKRVRSHSLSMGYMGVVLQNYGGRVFATNFTFPVGMTQGPDPNAPTSSTGFGFASLLLGAGSTGATGINAFPAISKNFHGWYIQDDWKVTPKLTLNLGLRYDIQTAPRERYGNQAYFDFSAVNPISSAVGFTVPGALVYTGDGNRNGLYEPQRTNIAPRIGLAYQAANKLVIRTGFGIFYVPAFSGGGPNPGFSQSTPFVGTLDNVTPFNTFDNPFPGGLIPPTGRSLGGLTNVGFSTNAVEPYRPTPYVEQWMFGIQYAIAGNDLLDVSYVGSRGVKMLGGMQNNQLDPQYLRLGDQLLKQVPNPFYGRITSSGCGLDRPTVVRGQLLRPFPEYCGVSNQLTPNGYSQYNALQMSYSHRWSMGLNILASYTFSKFMGNVEGSTAWALAGSSAIRDYTNLAAEKSVDANDIPHSFVLSYIYEIPVGKGKRMGSGMSAPVDAILGGWEVSGISTFKSGFPLSITSATNTSNSFGGGQRPNLVGDPHVGDPNIYAWFNTAAFVQAEPYTFGNLARYLSWLRAPGLNNWDVGIHKWWRWREVLRFQYRAEMFNAVNHANFYAPNQQLGNPAFGRITGTLPSRSIQMGLKLYW